MKFIITTLVTLAAGLIISAPASAKDCKTGKACGNACIAKAATCKADAAKPMATATPTPAPTPAKNCKTGKACGNACIAKDAVCSK